MKLTRTLVAAAALTALVGIASLPANAHSRYGGESYEGKPNLALTASLVKAGGGAAHYSTAKALTSMLGAKTVNAEVAKLNKDVAASLASPEFMKFLDRFAYERASTTTPEQLTELTRTSLERWAPVIKSLGLGAGK